MRRSWGVNKLHTERPQLRFKPGTFFPLRRITKGKRKKISFIRQLLPFFNIKTSGPFHVASTSHGNGARGRVCVITFTTIRRETIKVLLCLLCLGWFLGSLVIQQDQDYMSIVLVRFYSLRLSAWQLEACLTAGLTTTSGKLKEACWKRLLNLAPDTWFDSFAYSNKPRT